jgi:hypothetical protein
MDDLVRFFWSDLTGRLDGPFSFRLLLQPIMACLHAIHDGLADAREGRPPYFWTIFTRPGERWPLLREGLASVASVLILGTVIDTIYQLIVFRQFHPLELIVVVLSLAFVPYLLLRGPINRLASHLSSNRVRTP